MKAYILYTRPIPGYNKEEDLPYIVEVEGEMITAMEDPSVMWLPNYEFRFRISKPEFVYESREVAGKNILVPPVYHSHATYPSSIEALVGANNMVFQQFLFVKRKTGVDFTEDQVNAKCKEIQVIYLS